MGSVDQALDDWLNDEGDWEKIPGYPGYFVSQGGRVWSNKGSYPVVLQPYTNPHGYCMVGLSDGWKKKTMYVHEVVALAFLGPRPPKSVIRHLDGNPQNNALKNLRYGTVAENSADTKEHGTLMRGSRHVHARVDETDVRWIRAYAAMGFTHVQLSRVFQISPSTCSAIVKRRTWGHVA